MPSVFEAWSPEAELSAAAPRGAELRRPFGLSALTPVLMLGVAAGSAVFGARSLSALGAALFTAPWLALAAFGVRRLALERRLVVGGVVVPALVEHSDPESFDGLRGMQAHQVAFEWEGRRRTVSAANPGEARAGDVVSLLVDAADPARVLIYRGSSFRAVAPGAKI